MPTIWWNISLRWSRSTSAVHSQCCSGLRKVLLLLTINYRYHFRFSVFTTHWMRSMSKVLATTCSHSNKLTAVSSATSGAKLTRDFPFVLLQFWHSPIKCILLTSIKLWSLFCHAQIPMVVSAQSRMPKVTLVWFTAVLDSCQLHTIFIGWSAKSLLGGCAKGS